LDDITISRQRQTLAVVTDNIDLDWESKNDLNCENILSVTANATVTLLNTTNADFGDMVFNVTNNSTITFIEPGGETIISSSGEVSNLVWTPGDGVFSASLKKLGTVYVLIIDPNPAV